MVNIVSSFFLDVLSLVICFNIVCLVFVFVTREQICRTDAIYVP